MSTARSERFPVRHDVSSLCERTVAGAGFALTVTDRLGIERLLLGRGTRHAPNPPLLNGLLRHKLRISRDIEDPAPSDFVVSGRHVTYAIGGEAERSGILAMSPFPVPGRLLVASLLGATLVGMRVHQRAPLLRDDGEITTVVVLDASPPRSGRVA